MVDFTAGIEDGTLDSVVSASEGSIDVNQGSPSPTREHADQAQTIKDAQPKEQGKAPVNLRDQISSALKGEIDDGTPDADGTPKAPARAPDGKFAKADVAPVDGLAPDAGTAPVAQHIPAPAILSPEEREVFSKLPVELQTSVARTLDSVSEREARVKGLEQVDMLIAPRRQAWALNGMTEAQAMNQLLALSDFATTRPADFIQYFASQNNVDLEDIVFGAEPVDPQYKALQDELNQVKGALSGMTTSQQQAQHQERVDRVIDFALEKGPDGTLVRPHFEEIGEAIYPFIQTQLSRNPTTPLPQLLQESYEAACWATPSVRAKMIAATAAVDDAQRMQQATDRVARAKAAGGSLNGGVPSASVTPTTPANRSLRDEIRANLATMQ